MGAIYFKIDNKITGDVFVKLTREDLLELLPDDFLARKGFWDFLVELVR